MNQASPGTAVGTPCLRAQCLGAEGKRERERPRCRVSLGSATHHPPSVVDATRGLSEETLGRRERHHRARLARERASASSTACVSTRLRSCPLAGRASAPASLRVPSQPGPLVAVPSPRSSQAARPWGRLGPWLGRLWSRPRLSHSGQGMGGLPGGGGARRAPADSRIRVRGPAVRGWCFQAPQGRAGRSVRGLKGGNEGGEGSLGH